MRLILLLAAVGVALWLPRAPAVGQPTGASGPTAPLGADRVLLPMAPGEYGAIQHARSPLPPRAIALTFDDGPGARLNAQVLDILDRKGVKATFFLVGTYVASNPGQVREIVRRGHNVASHSWSHPTPITRLGHDGQVAQVRRSFAALEAALADAPPEERARLEPMFRFPGLGEGAYLRGWAKARGVRVVSAEAGTDDWRGYSAERILRRTVAAMEANDGGVLILHETKPEMIRALPDLIDVLRARGFTFVQITAGPDGRRAAEQAEDPLIHRIG